MALSVSSTLLLAAALRPDAVYSDLTITIVGSNDFYSQPRDVSLLRFAGSTHLSHTRAEPSRCISCPSAASQGPAPIAFAPLGCTIRDVHKTGLGSSAAMVTSLCSTLLEHVIEWDSSTTTDPTRSSTTRTGLDGRLVPLGVETVALMHNLAQYVHSLAQGKIGSGFDVSAAVWGSQVYKRFAVECLGNLLDASQTRPTSHGLLSVLSSRLNPDWATHRKAASVSPFGLPPGLILLLADVDSGSNTPSMVSKVLAWKKAQPEESSQVWDALRVSNAALAQSFADLAEEQARDPVAYEAQVVELAGLTSNQWKDGKMREVVAHVKQTRGLMRLMGEKSEVPIEPREQERLLDACSALPGVVGAGVPGGQSAFTVIQHDVRKLTISLMCLTQPEATTPSGSSPSPRRPPPPRPCSRSSGCSTSGRRCRSAR